MGDDDAGVAPAHRLMVVARRLAATSLSAAVHAGAMHDHLTAVDATAIRLLADQVSEEIDALRELASVLEEAT